MMVAVCFEIAGRVKYLRGHEVICGDRIWYRVGNLIYNLGIYRQAIQRNCLLLPAAFRPSYGASYSFEIG